MAPPTPIDSPLAEEGKERAGIQSVEVGFALLDVLAQAPCPLMLRDLAAAAGMAGAGPKRASIWLENQKPSC